jgi:hypothetical protein
MTIRRFIQIPDLSEYRTDRAVNHLAPFLLNKLSPPSRLLSWCPPIGLPRSSSNGRWHFDDPDIGVPQPQFGDRRWFMNYPSDANVSRIVRAADRAGQP